MLCRTGGHAVSTLEERTAVLEDRTDRLELLFERFMEQNAASLRSIEHAIEELKAEGARAREEAARARAEDRAEAARYRAEVARDREEAARAREEDRAEVARDREEAARAREEDRAEVARAREEAARARAEDRAEAARYRAEAARAREEAARNRAEDRAEAARDRKKMNRRWGELANKMGTVVQDIVAPSLRRIARDELGCGDERSFSVTMSRVRSDDPHRRREFDALYVGTQAVLLNETKSTALSEYAKDFVEFLKSGEFGLYFPEYRELPLVAVFSSLRLPDDVITYLTRNGIYAVSMGEETMQVRNRDAVSARNAR